MAVKSFKVQALGHNPMKTRCKISDTFCKIDRFMDKKNNFHYKEMF